MTRVQWVRFAAVLALIFVLPMAALAEETVSTTVVMRVSRMTQDAVVNAGEDLSIEISVAGVEPTGYQWYFEDQPIEGANQRVYNVVDAQPEDAGVYRMDAFGEAGNMLVSMDTAVRVVDGTVPKSGDSAIPGVASAAALTALAGIVALLIKHRLAA